MAKQIQQPKPALEIPAAITKAEIAGYVEVYGAVNRAKFHEFPPRGLVYRTFAGQLNPQNKKYEGAHLFDVAKDGENAIAMNFNEIFNTKD